MNDTIPWRQQAHTNTIQGSKANKMTQQHAMRKEDVISVGLSYRASTHMLVGALQRCCLSSPGRMEKPRKQAANVKLKTRAKMFFQQMAKRQISFRHFFVDGPLPSLPRTPHGHQLQKGTFK